MFTGIVAARGQIEKVESIGNRGAKGDEGDESGQTASGDAGVRLTINAGSLDLSDVVVGDSIAIQGACMTVTSMTGNQLTFDVSAESLDKTVGLAEPGEVNLEKALRLSDRLGGHLVSGHVDGIGEVRVFEPVGESWRLDVLAPAEIGRYLAYKGSVVVDGVSLTVNAVSDSAAGTVISINLIPHTFEVTTLGRLKQGSQVNLEIDLIARYIERMLTAQGDSGLSLKDLSRPD
ncbi:MAG: riboflavin synthase [Burkholderiaceae bacterium]